MHLQSLELEVTGKFDTEIQPNLARPKITLSSYHKETALFIV